MSLLRSMVPLRRVVQVNCTLTWNRRRNFAIGETGLSPESYELIKQYVETKPLSDGDHQLIALNEAANALLVEKVDKVQVCCSSLLKQPLQALVASLSNGE